MKLVDTEETVVLVTGTSLRRRSATGRWPISSSPRSTAAGPVTPTGEPSWWATRGIWRIGSST